MKIVNFLLFLEKHEKFTMWLFQEEEEEDISEGMSSGC